MDLDTLQKILALGTEHKWLALAIVVIGWLTAMTSDWSKFPITVSGRWQSALVVGLGLAYGVLIQIQDGVTWQKVLTSGLVAAVSTGFLYDLIIKGFCDGKVPSWLAWLALAKNPKSTSVKPPAMPEAVKIEVPKSPPVPPTSIMLFIAGASLIGLGVVELPACTPALEKAVAEVVVDDLACALANMDLPDDQLVTKCLGKASPEAREKTLHVVHEQRAERAKLVNAAHAQGFDEARAKLGCAPTSDAGAAKDGGAK